MLHERLVGMKTVGTINRWDQGMLWEIATPKGAVSAIIPFANLTSTADTISLTTLSAHCGAVTRPHLRAVPCTVVAHDVMASSAHKTGAPEQLLGCMTWFLR